MLVTTHAIVGAVAGEASNSPALSFGLGLVLHLLFDKIPHYFPQKMLFKEELVIPDTIISILFALSLVLTHTNSKIIWGALGGMSVDFILLGIPFLHYSKLGKWHVKRQHHKRNIKYLYAELLLIAGLFVFLLRTM